MRRPRGLHGIFKGLSEGLQHLHNGGIRHKDIKPCNILLFPSRSDGGFTITPIITDLGVSKPIPIDPKTKFTDSTYDYLAPEQVAHTGSSMKSDIFSLGCCFLEVMDSIRFQLLPSGNDIETVVKGDSKSCQFARELAGITEYLEEKRQQIGQSGWNMQRAMRWDIRIIFLLVDMLRDDPGDRLVIADVLSRLDDTYKLAS